MNEGSRRGSRAWYWLLLIPFILTLFPQFYASVTPELWGFPFFYWYQMLCVPVSAVLTYVVYRATKDR